MKIGVPCCSDLRRPLLLARLALVVDQTMRTLGKGVPFDSTARVTPSSTRRVQASGKAREGSLQADGGSGGMDVSSAWCSWQLESS